MTTRLTRNALVVVTLGVTNDASTPRSVFVGFAIGVWSASQVVAGVDTASVVAGEIVIAVLVGGALLLGLWPSATDAPGAVRITRRTRCALAHVTALNVVAPGGGSARVGYRALVHVDAADLWIARVARLTHALWWIARRALGIYSAREAVAWIC